jgi:hypothetical protein
MKKTRIAVALAVALAASLAAQSAFAWHHGGPRVSIGFGFGFGVPYAAYPYYYPPYYAPYAYPAYYPAPVVVQQQSPVYVEQNPQAAPSAQPSAPAGYWYYCAGSRAYYPYVKECPAGWQRVAPQPG